MSNNFVITVITAWFNINAYSWYRRWPYIWEIVYITRQALQWYPQVKNQGDRRPCKESVPMEMEEKGCKWYQLENLPQDEWGGGVLSVAYSPLWSKRQGSKQYLSLWTYIKMLGFFFFIEEETDFPFFGRYFEIMTIINNGKYFLQWTYF